MCAAGQNRPTDWLTDTCWVGEVSKDFFSHGYQLCTKHDRKIRVKSEASRNKESLQLVATLAGRGWGGNNAAMKQTFPMHSKGFPPQCAGPLSGPRIFLFWLFPDQCSVPGILPPWSAASASQKMLYGHFFKCFKKNYVINRIPAYLHL